MNMVLTSFQAERRLALGQALLRDETFAVMPQADDELGFYSFVPAGWKGKNWVVSVHGYTRNAAAHITQLSQEAARRECALIAPIFPKAVYPRFHKLVPSEAGTAPEAAFRVFLESARQLLQAEDRPAILGYSGGGQFLHRALMLQPGFCRKAVLFAPGWYTWPDDLVPYPYGLRASRSRGGGLSRLELLRDTPITLLVGDRDTHRDGTLNTQQRIDEQQGLTRVERAERWAAAVNEKLGEGTIQLRLLKGIGHDFTRNIKRRGLAPVLFDELLSAQGGA